MLAAPGAFTGGPVSYRYVLATGDTASVEFTASDPDGDPLVWQVTGAQAGQAQVGVSYPVPATGSTFSLAFAAVGAPAAASLSVLVEDPRGGVAAVDVLIVRSGAPTITDVMPSSAFAGAPQRFTLTGSALSLGGTVLPTVRFATVPATDVVVVDDATVTGATPSTLPLGATSVTATTPYGTGTLGGGSFTTYSYPVDLLDSDVALDAGAGTELVTWSDGASLQAVWIEAGALRQQRSLDGGATWSAAQTLSGAELPGQPQVIAVGDDVTVVWVGDGSSIVQRTSSDGGVTFAAATTLSTGSAPAARPLLAASGDRRHCAWLAGSSGLGAQRVHVASSSDAGASWTADKAVSDDGTNQSQHAIGCEGSAAWIALYQNVPAGSGPGVYTCRSSDGGLLWTAAVRRSNASQNITAVRTCNDGARAFLVWVRNDELEYMVSLDAGAGWPTQSTLLRTTDLGPISQPAVACEGERLFAAYVTGAAADTIAVSRVGAAGAVPEHVTVSTVTESVGAPQLAVRGNYAFVAWRGGAVGGGTGSARIRLSSSVDLALTFGMPVTFGDATSAQELPRLVLDGARLWLGWLDYRNGTPGLFSNRTEQ